MISTVWTTARHAFDSYVRSMETGDVQPFLTRVADDITFMVTIPEAGRGVRSGKPEVAELVRWRWHDQRLRPQITLDGITSNDQTVGFEYQLQGTLGDQPYTNHVAIFFDVTDDRITGFREYYGDNATPPEQFQPFGLEPVFREVIPGQGEATRGKPQTLSTTAPTPVSSTTRTLAQRAFDGFAESVEHGNWQPFLAVIADDVTFTLPIPGRWRGKRVGKAEAAEYHRWRWEDLRMRTPVIPMSVTANRDTVAFEFRIDGIVGQNIPAKHPAVYFMDVQGDMVVGFREYNGDEEPHDSKA